ncbi:fibronectin type III domain-containing protein [Flavobacterium sp. MK4S-17]|uniref:fibronectin type III domain-containing protein n=1 Tax=Flavobacterium sp. MK4S-17 TaxID=2543737 RepID=UPI00135776CC|nr:fibronectin type III domain-containing protein [Flavobacterium sp. MK4S-17]
MKTKITLLSLLAFLLFITNAMGQCTNGYQYPFNSYAPLNTGAFEIINNNCEPGEYAHLIYISTNRVYTFASSVPTDYITLTNFNDEVLAHGPSGLTYTPEYNTNLRYYIHADSNCSDEGTDRTRYIASQPLPSCGTPTALGVSNITSNSCRISWTAPATAPGSGYEVYASTTMITPVPSAAATATTTTNAVEVLSGLNAGTTYYYWVRSNCGQQKGVWVYGGGFTTNTWTACNGAVYGLYPQATFTPACIGNAEQISQSRAGEYANVNVLTDKQYTFESSVPTDYITITNLDGTTVYATGTTPLIWNSSTVSGVVRYYIHTNSGCGTENTNRTRTIACQTLPCGVPNNLEVSNITATTAKLTWSAPSVLPSGGYEVYLNNSGNTPSESVNPTATSATNIINPLRGLSEYTTYYFWVRSVCGTNKSAWIPGGSFKTNPLSGCNGAYFGLYPEQIFTPAGTGSSEIIATDSKAGQYSYVNIVANRQYTFASSDTGDYITITNEAGDKVFATGGSPLYWTSNDFNGVVRYFIHSDAGCVAESVDRTRYITCAVPGSCTWAAGIKVSDITSSSALVSWTPNSAEPGVSYFVCVTSSPYTAPNVGITLTGGTRPNGVIVNELQPNKVYYYYVKKSCNGGGSTPWVSGGVFRTISSIYISCNGAFYGIYPMETFTPACNGTPEHIGESAASQFSYVNLSADKQYIFQSTIGTDYLTITNEAGTNVLAKGSSPLTWNSGAFSGKVRFYLHSQVACGFSSSVRDKFIQCTDNCVAPGAATVSNINARSARLAWTGNASSYQYYYSTDNTAPADNYPATDNVTTNRNANIADLTPGATYYVWVRSVCGSGSSPWVAGQSFTTFAGGCFTGYGYPNSGFVPMCNGGPEVITTSASTAQYTLIDITESTSYIFESSVPTDYITITNAQRTVLLAHGPTPLSWSSNTNNDEICFFVHADINCGEDNVQRTKKVTCVSPNTCGLPTDIAISDITSNSATFSYTSPANPPTVGYQFQATLANTPPSDNIPAVANTINTYGTVSGLAPNTTYYSWVRSVCITGAGLWVAGPSFTTIPAATTGCNGAVNGLWPLDTFTSACSGTNEVITTSAFTGQFTNINIADVKTYTFTSSVATDYITITNEDGTETYAAGPTPLTWFSDSTSGIARFYLNSNSSCAVNSVQRTKSISCVTPVCDGVTSHAINNITSNSATLSWSQLSSIYQYYVGTENVAPSGTSAINTSSSKIQLQNLSPSTVYYYWIRVKCNTGINSTWVTGSFTTANALVCNGTNVPSGYSGLYPEQTFNPSCTGAPEVISNLSWAGEYSNVAIVPNKTYTFTSSVATDHITITTADGNTLLSSGITPVTWSSGNNTGTIRFFLHSNNSCGGQNVNRIRYVVCAVPCTAPVTPTFTQIQPICAGESFNLPIDSANGINGSWSPAINNMQTTTYTFTPDVGECAVPTTMTIEVLNADIVPTFDQVGPICPGSYLAELPVDSTNGINGSWSPAINNMATTTYTFTPAPGQCAVPTTMTIEATLPPNRVPTFTQVEPICAGGYLNALPTSSNEQIFGEWTPQLNNQATTTYTFTPDEGQCALPVTMTITVNTDPYIIPEFDQVPPICAGVNPGSLPIDSNNGINGSWSPAVNSTATTTYTFTPDPGQCAVPVTMTITVNTMPPAPADVVSCGTYILPELPEGYFYSGDNSQGAPLEEGTPIYSSQTVYYYYDNIPCSTQGSFYVTIQPVTQEVVMNGGTIAALMAGSGITYQWYKCVDDNRVIIPGATAQGFSPTENGYYQVKIMVPGCDSIYSDCVLVTSLQTDETTFAGELKIYPNPSPGQFTVETGTVTIEKITVIDNLGRIIKREYPSSTRTQVNIAGCADGVYFVKIENKGQVSVKKIVLKQ